MNYSYQINSPDQTSNCSCHQQIYLLQLKLREIHSKLLMQIDTCKDQETIIMELNSKINQIEGPNLKHRNVYETFGHHNKNKENHYTNTNYDEQSRQGYLIKNQLLQSDLDVMRHRVLTQITEKNKILQEMGDLKKRHRKQMAMQVKKFQGLDILYRKMLQDKGINLQENPLKTKAELDKLSKQLQETEQKYQRQRQKCKEIQAQNRSLIQKIQLMEDKQRYYSEEQSKGKSEQSSDQLRQIDSLKQQISRINKGINQRQIQFKDKSIERKKNRQNSRQNLSQQNMLVDPRWGRRQYS